MISAPKDIAGLALFREFRAELGTKRIMAILDVSERTITHWSAGKPIPRAAMLALYWETSYGRSLIDTDHHNELVLMQARIRILEGQIVKMKDIITGLRKLQYGTANQPLFDMLGDIHGTENTAPAQGTATTDTASECADGDQPLEAPSADAAVLPGLPPMVKAQADADEPPISALG